MSLRRAVSLPHSRAGFTGARSLRGLLVAVLVAAAIPAGWMSWTVTLVPVSSIAAAAAGSPPDGAAALWRFVARQVGPSVVEVRADTGFGPGSASAPASTSTTEAAPAASEDDIEIVLR